MVLAEKIFQREIHTADPFLCELSEQEKFVEVQSRLRKTFPAGKMDLTDPLSFQISTQLFYDVYRGESTKVPPCSFSAEKLEQLKGQEIIPTFDPDSEQWGRAEGQMLALHNQTTAGYLEQKAQKNGASIITPEQYQYCAAIQHIITGHYLDRNGLTKTRIPILDQRGKRVVLLVYFDQVGLYHCEVDGRPGERYHNIGGRFVYKPNVLEG